MPKFKPLFVAAIAAGFTVALFSAGYAAGQNGRTGPETKEQQEWKARAYGGEMQVQQFWAALASGMESPEQQKNARVYQGSDLELARLYQRAVRSPVLSEAALTSVIDSYGQVLTDKKEPRVSQTQLRIELLQIAQNQRIIELLERQAAGKK